MDQSPDFGQVLAAMLVRQRGGDLPDPTLRGSRTMKHRIACVNGNHIIRDAFCADNKIDLRESNSYVTRATR
jgi:hypothetical protein